MKQLHFLLAILFTGCTVATHIQFSINGGCVSGPETGMNEKFTAPSDGCQNLFNKFGYHGAESFKVISDTNTCYLDLYTDANCNNEMGNIDTSRDISKGCININRIQSYEFRCSRVPRTQYKKLVLNQNVGLSFGNLVVGYVSRVAAAWPMSLYALPNALTSIVNQLPARPSELNHAVTTTINGLRYAVLISAQGSGGALANILTKADWTKLLGTMWTTAAEGGFQGVTVSWELPNTDPNEEVPSVIVSLYTLQGRIDL